MSALSPVRNSVYLLECAHYGFASPGKRPGDFLNCNVCETSRCVVKRVTERS